MLDRLLLAYFKRFKSVYNRFNRDSDLYLAAYLFLSSLLGTWLVALAYMLGCRSDELAPSGGVLASVYLAPIILLIGLKQRFSKLDSTVGGHVPGIGESVIVLALFLLTSVAFVLYSTTLC